jgi:DNA polymerase type B, organellar and viral
MLAKVGNHELRDSLHIIPESLAELQKDQFDYQKMTKARRGKHKQEIIEYCLHDCSYLLPFIKSFINEFGWKISIGAAAISRLREEYKFDKISEHSDEYLRPFYFGGRVECLQGAGLFRGDYSLYDVNSMYPYVMATRQHPYRNDYRTHNGNPTGDTVFIELECLNYGALVAVDEEGKLSTRKKSGVFCTTIWEYVTAKKYGLIKKCKIIRCIDAPARTDFSRFVNPLYARRQFTKQTLKEFRPDQTGTFQFFEAKKDDIFLKLILNNSYGKFSQNPREWKEYMITDVGADAPDGYGHAPAFECADYELWERPLPEMQQWRSFNNVGIGASITGAARACLMEAVHHAVDPIYCDTDSLICRELRGVKIDNFELGAWKLETRISDVIIDGKKLYAYRTPDGKEIVKSKGTSGLNWTDMLHLLDGGSIVRRNKGVTLTRYGEQYYIKRTIRATETRRGKG